MKTNSPHEIATISKHLAQGLLLVLCYVFLSKLVLSFYSVNGLVTVLWPASGVALGGMLLAGRRYWLAVFVAALITQLWVIDQALLVSLPIAVAATIEPALGAWYLRRNEKFNFELTTMRSFLLLTFVSLFAPSICALSGTTVLSMAGDVPVSAYSRTVIHWWMGDSLGLLLITSLLLIWRTPPKNWRQYPRMLEAAGIVTMSFLMGQIVFFDWFHALFGYVNRGYWMFLFVILAAVRLGRHGVLIILSITTLQALVGAATGKGFFGDDLTKTGLINLWNYITILTMSGMLLAFVLKERFIAENQIKRSEADLQSAQHLAQIGNWEWNIEANTHTWSRDTYEIYGRDPALPAAIYPEVLQYFTADSWSRLSAAVEQCMAQGMPYECDAEVVRPDGSHRWVIARGAASFNEQGEVVKMHGTVQDITTRKLAQLSVTANEEKFRALFENSPIGIIAINPTNGEIVKANIAVLRMWQIDSLKSLGNTIEELVHPGDLITFKTGIHQLTIGGADNQQFEIRCLKKDGSYFWAEISVSMLKDASGEPLQLITSIVDVSERKILAESLTSSFEEIEDLYNSAPCGYHSTGTDFTFFRINDTELLWMGYTREEVIGKMKLSDFYTLESKKTFEINFPIFLRDGYIKDVEFEFTSKDGTVRNILYSATAIKDEHGNYKKSNAVMYDISERKKAELALQLRDRYQRALLDNFPFMVWLKDKDSRFLAANQRFADMLNVDDPDDMVGRTDLDYWAPELAAQYRADDRAVLMSGLSKIVEQEVSESGRKLWIETYKSPVKLDGRVIGTVGFSRDITARKADEQQLRKLSLAVEQSPESIVITNTSAIIEYVNEAFVRKTGYQREELLGKNSRMLQSGNTAKNTYDSLWKNLSEGRIWEGEFFNRRKDGSEYVEHAIVSPVRQANGQITHYLAVKEDITEKIRSKAEIHRLAYYDEITDLPNLAFLLDRVTQLLVTNKHSDQISALIAINLDRFKTINDATGQTTGNALLKAVGQRLVHILRDTDLVASIAGDEFCVLLPELGSQNQMTANLALQISQKIHSSLHETFAIGREKITLTACHGIALFPSGNEDTPLEVLRRANTALHHAKASGTEQTVFFEESLEESARQRFSIESELHDAITSGQLRLYLQTQVDANGLAVGAEALVRWQHPIRGLIQPNSFIPIAEESNLIIEIGNWVLTQVCQLLAHEDVADLPLRISVNISPRQFRQTQFVDQIKNALAKSGTDPNHLTLEVTEGLVIDNINDVIAKMHELSTMGIHFSMDDFGTGYSSLSYLKRLPIHELKIDKSFVQDVTTDMNDAALVETILSVAKHLHLRVVAEGVETSEQADFLNQRGTVIHQGYFFHKPEPQASWLTKLQQHPARLENFAKLSHSQELDSLNDKD
ncbi:PAS domain S-box protein [Undibacterium sp. Ren11W]|uniref:PAS domain S-box protein n=1 Tax=Undibacterium sp. Ren11W TaxID=3413045 RepID=UPI003BEFD169